MLIFNDVRERGPISRSQLAKELGLSPTTVTVIVDYFMEHGFLMETGKGDSSGGRKPILVKLAPDAGHVIAVDLNQSRAAILNLEAEILRVRHLPDAGKEGWVRSLIQVINSLILESGADFRLLGIGIAVPGIVSLDKGEVITATNFNINHLSLKEELQKHFHVPILLENDANAAAYGEYLYGYGKQVANFVYLHVGKAVGAGLFLAGNLFTGGAGGAGELGHITVVEDGPKCRCGNQGCLELMINESALADKWQEWVTDGAIYPGLSGLVQLSNSGHGGAQRVMNYVGSLLGRGLVTLIHLINPSFILLGGELALSNPYLLQRIKKYVSEQSIPIFSRHVEIKEGMTRSNAGIIGAGSLALHYFFEHLHLEKYIRA
ncbi:ROK family transcriptional regulator [Paenibacillus cremeus]|uniref:ROK family transcriptional regulator n=1 Tax=Paenibacillus cremeus TaxID=2163881 RepID=A0A559KIP4_9BACL|nr:ROK family transcriptional regulator [Paenibacillus cremeus]TVY12004.1 ROK family transcriptional regulator [Paenibacillus cremeus]